MIKFSLPLKAKKAGMLQPEPRPSVTKRARQDKLHSENVQEPKTKQPRPTSEDQMEVDPTGVTEKPQGFPHYSEE
jgi:hypothetical protein